MSSLRVQYQTIEFGETDIHVRSLRDTQQFQDDDGIAASFGISSAAWSLFGVVWPASEVLAHVMADYDVEGKRILEVGCGIGLASLLLNHRNADITATDYHPEAEHFLNANVSLNQDDAIPFVRTGWEDEVSDLGKFDLIIGSDIMYERFFLETLANFIDQHAKPKCDVVLVDPGRGHHARFSKYMVALGYTHTQHKPAHSDYLDEPFRGQILSYRR